MTKHLNEFPLRTMCRVLGVSRAGYYDWRRRSPSKRSNTELKLTARISELHSQSDKTYGSPRILAELRDEGQHVSRKRVARIMRENGLISRHRRKFRVTTNSAHPFPLAENSLGQNFQADEMNRKWVTDVTFIPTDEGWLYLAVVLDLFSRRVVGWSMDSQIERSLTIRALQMALKQRKPASGLVHHSDRGSHYANYDYRLMLEANEILSSMSRRGNCWDNAVAESFFKTLKVERVRHRKYRTRAEAREDLFEYIEVFYNRKRRHSANGFVSPVDFEARKRVA
jgi:putative transposase